MRSAVSSRTSGSNPAARQSGSCKWRGAGAPGVLSGSEGVVVTGRHLKQPGIRLALGNLDSKIGMLRPQYSECLRNDGVGGRLEHGDTDGSVHRGEGLGHGSLCLFELVEDGATVVYEHIALGGELDPSPCRLEQRNTDLAFELTQ